VKPNLKVWLVNTAERLSFDAGNGRRMPRVGAEPLGKLAFAGGGKTVVALGEPRNCDVLDGG
jgi:hypothetical protein